MRGSIRRRVEQAFWDFHSRGYDDAAASSGPFEHWLADWIGCPPTKGHRVLLDLGCGTGRLLAPLAAAGWYVVGGDVSPEMLRKASSKVPENVKGMTGLVRLDLNRPLPFSEVSQVILIHSLQVVRHPDAVLRHVHEVLEPGGRVLVVAKKKPAHPRRTNHLLTRRLKQVAGIIGWTRSFPGDSLSVFLDELGFHICQNRSDGEITAVMAAKGRP